MGKDHERKFISSWKRPIPLLVYCATRYIYRTKRERRRYEDYTECGSKRVEQRERERVKGAEDENSRHWKKKTKYEKLATSSLVCHPHPLYITLRK